MTRSIRISGKSLILTGVTLFCLTHLVQAQSSDDVLRYSLEYPTYDPVSLVVPGVTQATGFGAFQENPASMALFEESFLSFDLSSRLVNENGRFHGTEVDFDDNQTGIGDVGFLYSVPAERGSLVIGGGFSQSTDFNRALSVSARNNVSTLTDFYNITSDDSLFFAAFDTYAIDFATTDSLFSETASIFRIGFDEFPGINQEMELTERGQMGEYSTFVATEFQENLLVGASVGLVTGSYSYRRNFLEADRQNDYNFDFIDTDNDGTGDTDIDRILSTDTINAELLGFSARVGMIYKVTPNLNIGASYHFPPTLQIDEEFNTEILTTFDNGVQFSADAPGEFSFKITRPGRVKAGFSIADWNNVNLSASAEGVFYTKGRIDFDDLDLNQFEREINDVVRSNFKDVVNIRAGLEYSANDRFVPRIGYGYYPSPRSGTDATRQFVSGGFSAEITYGLIFNFGVQYGFWDDENSLYSFDDGTAIRNEVVQEEVRHWNIMGGLKLQL